MIAVAIVAREKSWYDQLITQYNRLPIHLYWFADAQQFVQQKEFETWQIVWVIGKDMPWVQEQLVTLNEAEIQLPLICSTPQPNKEDRQLLWQLRVNELLVWPIHRLELEYILKSYEEILRPEMENEEYVFQGALDYLHGIDLFRVFTKATSSGLLHLQWGERKGHIEFKNGQIVHAQYRQMDPLTSVLIMSSWDGGFAYFKPDAFATRRTIMLSNEQIFEECAEYLHERQELVSAFGDAKTLFYPHPDLNYEDFGPTERQILRAMRKGKSISEFIVTYEGDVNFLLRKMKIWLEKEYILPEPLYAKIKAQIEERENTPAFKRIMQKLFTKKEEDLERHELPSAEAESPSGPMFSHRFQDFEALKTIKARLEESH